MGADADYTQELARALRTASARLADAVDGGVTLIYALAGEGDPRLRAAAGFPRPEDARQAGAALAPCVRETLAAAGASRQSGSGMRELTGDALGSDRALAGVRIHPVRAGTRAIGAVAVGSPGQPTAAQDERVAELVETVALQLHRAHLHAECTGLRARLDEQESGTDDSEEVLRLSEALFAQDIELLRSHEKLGKVERLKDDFIEKMSRELRTPLNGIIEAIISVLTGEDDALSEAAKLALRGALDEGTSFLRTLQNILDLWRIKQGELPVETQEVNFRELVDEAIFSVQDTVGDRPLRIQTELVEPFPRLRTDLAKLNQILFLLLDNATKFTPQGTITIRGRVREGRLGVSIEDDGIGICHDDLELIFDEFFQVDEASSQKYRGSGLGLTLVRDLVALLGGQISVESDIGHGTTVSFSIPLQDD